MLTLGLETSCDETAAAVIRDGRVVLSDVVSTQIDIHRRWGGVVPELASRAHIMQVMPVIAEALHRARVDLADIKQIAVTSGPGLQGALLVGLQVAKSLSAALHVPFVGVNHLEGHLLAIRLSQAFPQPPFVGLIVSGGHTALYAVPALGRYVKLGGTVDDAAGEAYDKVAKLLGLPYPGGKPIDDLARTGDPKAIAFPRSMPGDNVNFSFSGLKTAVARHLELRGVPSGQGLFDLCASFQEAVADVLTAKLFRAAKKASVRHVVMCGGVACNSRLRTLAQARAHAAKVDVHVPPPALCSDNGAMIAVAGFEAFARGIRSDLSLNAEPTWKLA